MTYELQPVPCLPLRNPRHVAVMRYVALVVGCMGVGISYVVNAFLVFALALKALFGLSQTQLLMLLSAMFLGLCASLPGGKFLDRFGARWASFLALVVSVSGYILCWSATMDSTYYAENFYILLFYFLIAGIGGGLTYMTSTVANVRNFGERSRGTIVGVLHASLSAGPAILIVVYEQVYMTDYVNEPAEQDIQGFFVFLTVAFGFINLLGVLVYDYYPPDDPEKFPLVTDSQDSINSISAASAASSMESQLSRKEIERSIKIERSRQHAEMTGSCHNLEVPSDEPEQQSIMVFLTVDFQLLFWPFTILTALQMMFVQNLTTVLVSFDQEAYLILFPYLTPILGTLAKPLIGMVSDLTVKQIPRTWYIIFGALASVILWLSSAYLISDISVIVIATTLCDLAAYFVYALGPAIVIERYGLASFSQNWGIVMGGFSIMTSILLFILGAVYDQNVDTESVLHICKGLHCYFTTFIISSMFSVVALVCSVVYHVRRMNRTVATAPPQLSGMINSYGESSTQTSP